MRVRKSRPLAAGSEEVSALIATLHQAGQRLEELTGGEVDAVASPGGRTLLLPRAQEEWRHSEAARQAAILNALPAHIALLNAQGLIVSVNEAWRRFAVTNGLQGCEYGIGLDYLGACNRATGANSAEAGEVAEGIRAVQTGRLAKFSIEYPCHSPTEQRWFQLTVTPLAVTPLAEGQPQGVVVMHLDISERKRGDQQLLHFASAMDATTDAIYLVDRSSMGFVHVNEAACRMNDMTRAELFALGPAGLLSATSAELESVYDSLIASGVAAEPLELLRSRKNGTVVWVELRRHAQINDGRWTIVTLVRDITDRKKAERRITDLNRVRAVLGGINSLIVRVQSRSKLFGEACRIAVDAGQFRMAWIGIVDLLTLKLVPVASAGVDPEFLGAIKGCLSSSLGTPLLRTVVTQAITGKQAVVTNDLQGHPAVVFAKQYAEYGIRSLAIFPLLAADEVLGVIALYSSERDFFQEEELKLLTELSDDIVFAMEYLHKQERLDYLAYYDVLTGLANRSLFLDRVAQHIHSAISGGQKLALFLVDLERFKNLNDSLGRPAGDALLKQVAKWLTDSLGEAKLVARVGSDVFAFVVPEVKLERYVKPLLEKRLQAFLTHPFRLNDAVFRIAAKVGVALFPNDGSDAETLYRNAEAALKKAKERGERYLFYTRQMTETVTVRLNMENRLRHALEKSEFVLHYQPKINLQSGKITGAEALIRWNDPQTGLVPPGRFIPILEETGMILEVGRWALRKAVEDYLRWRRTGLNAVRIAVNVSPLQLRSHSFIAELEQVIGMDAQAAAGLELELTESLIMEDVKHTIGSLEAIRAMKICLAIDDFGTGFSSLSYLLKLPVHSLKIDRSFIVDMTAGPEGLALVSSIINLAHGLKLKVVAEGVETVEQSRLLRLLNCDEMQGFFISRATPSDIFEKGYLSIPVAGE